MTEVLWKKTARALGETGAKTLVLGGGVSANVHIKRVFTKLLLEEFPQVTLRLPQVLLTTDNALMIGMAGYFRARAGDSSDPATLTAKGNLSLAK